MKALCMEPAVNQTNLPSQGKRCVFYKTLADLGAWVKDLSFQGQDGAAL